MTIAYLLDTYPSLTETFIAREIAALRRRGFTIEVFALHAGEGARPLVPGKRGGVPASMRWRGALGAFLSRDGRGEYFKRIGANWWKSLSGEDDMQQNFDHIHAGFASHPAFIAWGAAEAAGVPWSFSGHARDLFVDGTALKGKLSAARFAAVCTRAGQQLLKEQAPDCAGKIHYAPHGLEIAQYNFRARHFTSPSSEKPLQVLSVGRLVEKKGFTVLLEALSLLRAQHYPVACFIIGEGPLRSQLQGQIERFHLVDTVKLCGSLPHQATLDAMSNADCLVMPCIVARDGDRDGLPNVLLEGAACGVPLVSTRTGGVTDFLDESTGRLCAPGDVTALSMAMRAVADEPDVTGALCRAARQRVVEQFDIERNIDRLAQAFEQRG